MRSEFEKPETEKVKLFEKFVYQNPDRNPAIVTGNTSEIFSKYFEVKVPLTNSEREYLARYTLPFIDSIRAGLASHPEKVDKLGISKLEDYMKVKAAPRPSVMPPDETLEALDLALITMGIMPDVAFKKHLDQDGNEQILRFSRRGILKPPETLEETRERIHEMWIETIKVGEERTPRKINIFQYPQTARTALFFDVYNSFPIRNEIDMQKDVEIKLAV